jgi:hypothetical protein
MSKRPAFQFYPSDWLRDTALRSCSMGARGLWIDMICYMHEGNPYGHLKVGDKVILPTNLARMVGEALEVVEGWLAELKQAGVYDLTSDGVIVSRRMIRDENLRNIRASGGKLGGNPTLMDKGKVNLKDNHKVENKDNQNPTPSSSSSSSNIKPPIPPKGGNAISLNAYLKICKDDGKKAIPEGHAVFAYAEKAGIPHEFLKLHWLEFKDRYSHEDSKRYKAWPTVFLKSVRGNWFKLWYAADDGYALTTVGLQAKKLHKEAA